MLIAHVLAPAPVGGLEQVVSILAPAQRRAGQDARVVAVLDQGAGNTPFLAALERNAVPLVPLVLPPRAYRLERSRLADALRPLGRAVVHTHGYRGDIQGGAVARRLGMPTVTTVHGFTGGGWKNRLYERLQRRAFRRCAAVVAVSRPLAAELAAAGVAPDRIHLIPNAAPPPGPALDRPAARRELAIDTQGFLLGWVGRLSHEKGADLLIEALALLPAQVEAVVIGDGDASGMLASLAARRTVGRRVHWRGLVKDAARLFAAFDCFVLSSRTEGTPMVLFEAMAAGVPIVAARVGGVPDVLSEAEAVLVPPNEPGALAAAVAAVMADDAAARARAAGARRRFDGERRVEPWAARYEAVYRQVLVPPSSPISA